MDILKTIRKNGMFARSLQFESLALFCIVLTLMVYFFPTTYGFVILNLMFAAYITLNFYNYKRDDVTNFNDQTMLKLHGLQNHCNEFVLTKYKLMSQSTLKPDNKTFKRSLDKAQMKHLYMDATIIHFLDSISVLYKSNPSEFYKLLKGIDELLRLENEMEVFYESNGYYPTNTSEMTESAIQLRSNTLNNLHNFIYTVNKDKAMYKYLKTSMDRLDDLLSRHITKLHKYQQDHNKITGINTNTKFIYPDMPRGVDPDVTYNKSFYS